MPSFASSAMPPGSAGKFFPSRLCSAQVLAAALVAVEVEEVHMHAQPTRADKVAAVEAAAANATEAVCIPLTAWAQCGIVAAGRSLE